MAEQTQRPGRVLIENVRCSFPNLIELREYDGKPKYNITLLIPKSESALVARIGAAINAVINDKWPIGGKTTAQNQRPQPDKIAFKNGDDKDLNGFENCWFIHATANPDYPPQVIDQGRNKVTSDKVIYGGCYVNAVIEFFAWESKQFGRGVSASILAVQKALDGERFGGEAIDPNEYFKPIAATGGLNEIATGEVAGQGYAGASDGVGKDDLPF